MIPTGKRFVLFAYALDPKIGRIRAIGNSRVKLDVASRSIRDRWLATSWPATSAGEKAAHAWSADCNRRIGAKILAAVQS